MAGCIGRDSPRFNPPQDDADSNTIPNLIRQAMNSLIQLLVCHALAGCGAFFAANGIDGSTTTGILVGIAMLALGVAVSAVTKWFKLDPVNLTGNVLLRQFLGACHQRRRENRLRRLHRAFPRGVGGVGRGSRLLFLWSEI